MSMLISGHMLKIKTSIEEISLHQNIEEKRVWLRRSMRKLRESVLKLKLREDSKAARDQALNTHRKLKKRMNMQLSNQRNQLQFI